MNTRMLPLIDGPRCDLHAKVNIICVALRVPDSSFKVVAKMAVILDLIKDKEFIGKVLELKIFPLTAYVK